MDKLTIKAQEAMQQAQAIAERNQNMQIDLEHLLSALLAQTEGVAVPLLQKLGANVSLLAQQIDAEIAKFPKISGAAEVGASMTPPARRAQHRFCRSRAHERRIRIDRAPAARHRRR